MSTAEPGHWDFFLPQQRQPILRCLKQTIYPLAIKRASTANWDVNTYFADLGFNWSASHGCRATAEPKSVVTHHRLSAVRLLPLFYWQFREKISPKSGPSKLDDWISPDYNPTLVLTLVSCHNSLAANRALTFLYIQIARSERNKPLSTLMGDTEDAEGADVGCCLSNSLHLVGIQSRRPDPWQKCLNI